ncbi:MAG: chemotaxis protein CheW [Acidobacteriota bacterium]
MSQTTVPPSHVEITYGVPSTAPEPDLAAATRQFLTFRLADERFGISIDSIVEILKYRPATPVPRADPVVHGIVSVRGQVVTVLDGRLRLGLPAAEIGGATRIIVVHDGSELVGLLVDEVVEVVRLADDAIAAPPATVRDAGARGIVGVCDTHDEKILILLDIDRVLRI